MCECEEYARYIWNRHVILPQQSGLRFCGHWRIGSSALLINSCVRACWRSFGGMCFWFVPNVKPAETRVRINVCRNQIHNKIMMSNRILAVEPVCILSISICADRFDSIGMVYVMILYRIAMLTVRQSINICPRRPSNVYISTHTDTHTVPSAPCRTIVVVAPCSHALATTMMML